MKSAPKNGLFNPPGRGSLNILTNSLNFKLINQNDRN